MIGLGAAAAGFGLMLAMMSVGLHVAFAMFAVAILAAGIYIGPAIVEAYGTQLWSGSDNFVLLAVPLFVLLGEIMVRSGMIERTYNAIADWLAPLPGGLLHTNIGASALFAALSGSSVATAATIATVALPEFKRKSYDQRLVLGTIAAGATLGILIPPSINMIIYGAMTNTSVGRLYAAGIIPGILLTVLFMVVVAAVCLWRPSLTGSSEVRGSRSERLRRLLDLVPPLIVFVVVMGSIYAGWATATESAAVGVLIALLLAAMYRSLSINMLHECFLTTINVTAMITLIVLAASYLNFVLGILGIPQTLSNTVAKLGTDPIVFLWALFVFYLILGCFMETLSMMIGTIPVVFPLVVALGIDPVWFGIFLVVMCELSLITPPVGMNLYVVQGVRREGSINEVIVGTLPFLFMMILLVALLVYFPELALWLPNKLFQ
jgi:tripartite ATP-independent transporter DctM subunit